MTAKILNCSYEDYLADNIGLDVPTLNASVAKVLIQQSPAHAVLSHPKFNPQDEDPSKCRDKGSALHSLLLNKGKSVHIMQSIYGKGSKRAGQTVVDFTSKEAQQERDEAYANGKIPLFLDEAEQLEQAAMVLSRKISDLGIHLDGGESEFMITWKADDLVDCRTSFDNWTEPKLQAIELKSIFSAHPDVCASQAFKLGYHIGYAARLEALYTLYPEYAGRIDFIFLFCEIEPPYALTPLRPDGTFTHLGIQQWERAKALWHTCMKSANWPAYQIDTELHPDGIGRLSAPTWALKEIMEELA